MRGQICSSTFFVNEVPNMGFPFFFIFLHVLLFVKILMVEYYLKYL